MKKVKDVGSKHQLVVRFAVISSIVYAAPARVLSRFEKAVVKIMCRPFSPQDMRTMVLEIKDIGKMIRALRGLLIRRAGEVFDFPDDMCLLDDVAALAQALKWWKTLAAKNKGLEAVAIMRGDVIPVTMDYTMVARRVKSNKDWGMETTILTNKVDEET